MRTEFAVAAFAVAAAESVAAQTGPWYLALGQSLSRESNIYRLADGISPVSGSRADTAWISSLLAGVDQTISRQRLRADLSLRASRFSDNRSLDNQGHGLRLIWDWATVGRIEGSVAATFDRSLVRFDNSDPAGGLARNIGSTKQLDASLRAGLVTRWSAEAGFNHTETDYSPEQFAFREYRQDSVNGGLRYTSSPDMSLSVGLRALQGRYPHFAVAQDGSYVVDRYEGRYLDVGVRYGASGASRFELRLSSGSTSFERASATDFSGLTGALTWNWRPTAKLRLDTRFARDRGQESASLGFFITNTGLLASGRFADFSRTSTSLASTLQYELSAKVSLTAAATYITRDLSETRQDPFGRITTRGGRDRMRQFSLGARWQASRSILLGCDISSERRVAANELSSDMSNQTHGCYGQVGIP